MEEAFQKSGVEPDAQTTQVLEDYKRKIASLQAQLATQQQRLTAAKKPHPVEKGVRNRRSGFKTLPPAEKSRIARILLRGIVLNRENIILDRRIGAPVIGMIQKREGTRSNPYRFMDITWLD